MAEAGGDGPVQGGRIHRMNAINHRLHQIDNSTRRLDEQIARDRDLFGNIISDCAKSRVEANRRLRLGDRSAKKDFERAIFEGYRFSRVLNDNEIFYASRMISLIEEKICLVKNLDVGADQIPEMEVHADNLMHMLNRAHNKKNSLDEFKRKYNIHSVVC